ncbi:MAG: patatin family protein [Clostridiales bacterium]|nr:patatin family protein [Clostridiales bacterium]
MTRGLVLEGGAMRGLFTAGILDVLMENGIVFQKAAGVSAGVAFGCNYKSRQIGRVLRYNLNYSSDWRYKSYRSLILTGDLYGADFCYHELPDKLDVFDTTAFEADPLEFYAVATDVMTGKAVYHLLKDGGNEDLEWIRASASMPLASRVVDINGQKLLDGGISDSIPLEFLEKKGCNRNLVILTQPLTYTKHQYHYFKAIAAALHRYPALVSALKDRPSMYNAQVAYVKVREAEGSAFVLRPPSALNIPPLEKDPDEIRRVYNVGRDLALSKLDEIIDFLS